FSKLTLLEFKEVDLPDNYDFFGALLPRCPLLEELMVLDCNIFIDPLFESASLKALFFHSSFTTICIKNTPCLSVLSVDDYNAGEYDPDIVALFAALPALKQLKLGLELLHDEHYEDHSEVIDSLQMLLEPKGDRHCGGVCCLQRLEEFSIDNSRCNQVVLDLVRFVLATAPLLKRVFIKPKKGLSSRNAKKFLVKVTRYNRISKEGEVRYMD
ncbi:hypothetical protein LINPERPRIM_LOCUS35769, partial [Linum perenne]